MFFLRHSVESWTYISDADTISLSSFKFLAGFVKRFYARVSIPFKVIQGHWFWCWSKARVRRSTGWAKKPDHF